MHTVTLAAGVIAIAVSIYFFLGITYPFISCYPDPVFGNLALFGGGLLFGGFGCYLSWESIIGLEDRKIAKRISRKRRKKLYSVAQLARE